MVILNGWTFIRDKESVQFLKHKHEARALLRRDWALKNSTMCIYSPHGNTAPGTCEDV